MGIAGMESAEPPRDYAEVKQGKADAGLTEAGPFQAPELAGESPDDAIAQMLAAKPGVPTETEAAQVEEREPTRFARPERTGEEQALEDYVLERFGDPVDETLDLNSPESIWRTAEEAVAIERDIQKESADLVAQHPAALSDAAVRAMEPYLADLAEEHGEAAATDPRVVAALYLELGGDARFAEAAENERIIAEMLNATGERTGDRFTDWNPEV